MKNNLKEVMEWLAKKQQGANQQTEGYVSQGRGAKAEFCSGMAEAYKIVRCFLKEGFEKELRELRAKTGSQFVRIDAVLGEASS